MDGIAPLGLVEGGVALMSFVGVRATQPVGPRCQHLAPASRGELADGEPVQHFDVVDRVGPERRPHLGGNCPLLAPSDLILLTGGGTEGSPWNRA